MVLGLIWLLDAALQYQPYMFTRAFVKDLIEPTAAGNPSVVSQSVTWSAHLMVHHIATYNAVFATVQLLIALGILWRPTVRPALAASVVWALAVWWFGEGLGGIFTGTSPVAGSPGGVVLYALIAVLLWSPAPGAHARQVQPHGRRRTGQAAPSPATSGPLGDRGARGVWLVLWGSFCYFLLLPANRSPSALGQTISGMAGGEPAWAKSILVGLDDPIAHRGTEVSFVLAVICGLVALAIFAPALVRTAVITAAVLGLLCWAAEAFGGIFTGQGTDPNSGLLLILLAFCYWPTTVPGASPPWALHRAGRAERLSAGA